MLQFLMNMDREVLLWIQDALRHDILTPLFIGLTRLGDSGAVQHYRKMSNQILADETRRASELVCHTLTV